MTSCAFGITLPAQVGLVDTLCTPTYSCGHVSRHPGRPDELPDMPRSALTRDQVAETTADAGRVRRLERARLGHPEPVRGKGTAASASTSRCRCCAGGRGNRPSPQRSWCDSQVLGPVLQQPSRKNPVTGSLPHGSRSPPRTFALPLTRHRPRRCHNEPLVALISPPYPAPPQSRSSLQPARSCLGGEIPFLAMGDLSGRQWQARSHVGRAQTEAWCTSRRRRFRRTAPSSAASSLRWTAPLRRAGFPDRDDTCFLLRV